MIKGIMFLSAISLIFLATLGFSRASESKEDDAGWISGELKYEGFPLMLRRPGKINYDQLEAKYPILITITHQFEKVRTDGMPDPDYNLGLADLDHEIITHFAKSGRSQTVLIETFGGKRNYYIYVIKKFNIEAEFSKIKIQFPGQKLTVSIKNDPKWKFIRGYAKDYWLKELPAK